MNIVIAANEDFVFATEIFIYSLLKHNASIKIFLLYSNIREESLHKIQDIVKTYGKNSVFCPVKIDDSILGDVPTSGTITKEAYYRLLIPQLLSDEDRALYLDTDIIVRKPLSSLYNLELNGAYAAACEDWGMNAKPAIKEKVFKKLEFNSNHTYFNSGVWLFNLKLMREECGNDYLINQLKSNVDRITFHDQDVLNLCCSGKILPIDFMYNCRSYLFSAKEEPYILKNAVIIHYGQKPWNPNFTDICGKAFWDNALELGYKKEYRAYLRSRLVAMPRVWWRQTKKNLKKYCV